MPYFISFIAKLLEFQGIYSKTQNLYLILLFDAHILLTTTHCSHASFALSTNWEGSH